MWKVEDGKDTLDILDVMSLLDFLFLVLCSVVEVFISEAPCCRAESETAKRKAELDNGPADKKFKQ